MPKIGAPEPEGGSSVAAAKVKTGRCVFRTASGLETLETPFYRREALPLGEAIHGPAIVLQKDSTTVVPPDATFTSDPSGNLILRLETL